MSSLSKRVTLKVSWLKSLKASGMAGGLGANL